MTNTEAALAAALKEVLEARSEELRTDMDHYALKGNSKAIRERKAELYGKLWEARQRVIRAEVAAETLLNQLNITVTV